MNKIIQSIMLEQDTSNFVYTPYSVTRETKVTLHQAILDGRLQQIKYLIKMGCRIDSKDKYGRTCLMLACLCDHEEYAYKVAKLLLKCAADVNLQDSMGRTAISIAITQKREKLVELFVVRNRQNVDFHLRDNDGNVLLNTAAIYGTSTMVRLLIEQMKSLFIPIDQRNSLGYTALLLAIKHKRYLNAYVILTDGQASCFIKDNEHFLNAYEWLTKDHTNLTEFMKNESQITTKSLSRSNTFCSSNSYVSNLRSNGGITYKTWYNIPNQYHSILNTQSKCEHVTYTNFAIDIQNSSYTPAILTPRCSPPTSPQKQTHEVTDGQILIKLVEKIRQMMSHTTPAQNRQNINSASTQQHDKDKQSTSNRSANSSQCKTQSKTILIDHFPTLTRHRSLSIDTEKLLNLASNDMRQNNKTIKEIIPKIMENYTGRASNKMSLIKRNKSDRTYFNEANDTTQKPIQHNNIKSSTTLAMTLPNKPAILKDAKSASTQNGRANKEVTFHLD